MTHIAIQLPDDVAGQLEARWGNLPRRLIEVLAAEAYRAGVLSAAQVQRLLNLRSRWEVDAFLKKSQAYLDYTEADLDHDSAAIRKVLPP